MAFGVILGPFGEPLGTILAKSGVSEALKNEVEKNIEIWLLKGVAESARNLRIGLSAPKRVETKKPEATSREAK